MELDLSNTSTRDDGFDPGMKAMEIKRHTKYTGGNFYDHLDVTRSGMGDLSELMGDSNDPELMGGWLRDHLKAIKSKLTGSLSKMPKWKRALLCAAGLGLVAPMTATAAMTAAATVGVPTLLTAGTIRLARKKAIPALQALKARIAAKRAAGEPIPEEMTSQASALQGVISTPDPEYKNSPVVDATIKSAAAAETAPKSGIAAALPAVGIGIALLQMLKK